ncbi:hypothetical protein [Brevibacillus migulae]|uniref:hypothetical protein n=1 Tax=Brevibacillus migulae TaxID=1644114 RepID=UPI00106E415A|nr:hypothetical protein [Brevibacillus migulae]
MPTRLDLLIKHMVGSRPFLETTKTPVPFTIEERSGGWLFTIHLTDQQIIADILENRMELNLFVVETHDDLPVHKWWYYSKDGDVSYDEQQSALLIFADSRMGYQA